MLGIVGIITLLTVLGLSLVVTRIATIALTLTGLSQEAARFQARSAFTGTGFTTRESEKVVGHPVRRRIIMLLMIIRSAGLVSVIISLILSFAGSGTDVQRLYRLLWLVGGVIVLWVAAQSAYLDRTLSRTIEWALKRWTDLDTRDYQSLLRLSGKYTVKEMRVAEGGWVADRTLRECRLTEEGVIVLGINRSDGSYVGVPTADTKIHPDDTLILYGRSDALQELDQRRANFEGEQAHDRAVSDQQAHVARQEAEEQARERQRELQEA